MKKLVTLLMIVCLVLSGCSGSSPAKEPLTLSKFEEKYKRADWDEMLASPIGFIGDLHSIETLPLAQAIPEVNTFESTEESYGTEYEKDIVLFNRTFRLRVTDFGKYFSCTLVYSSEPQDCFDAFKAMFEGLIKSEGDPWNLSVDRDDVDEAAFRKALNSGDLETPLSAHWAEKAEPDYITVALISYWNFVNAELTIY